ncbi:MAG TPA: hypothetical protein PLF38_01425 [Xylanibacter oryzae]|nr:hypothetical protein [Xylanibacter oryzae]
MKNSICIFPKEKSTEFLQPIYDILISSGVTGYNIDTTIAEEKAKLLKDLKNSILKDDAVYFLGHGTSYCLYGTNMEELINKWNINILKGKRLFLLSCRSTDLIKSKKYKNAIGFPDLPTSMDDILDIRTNEDPDYLKGIDEDDINAYNESLIRIICSALKHSDLSDTSRFESKIRMYANIEIVKLLTEKPALHYRDIANLIYEFKTDMISA